MPMLFSRGEPYNVARADFCDSAAFALHPAAARCDDQRLAERVGVPRGPRARFERHARPLDERGIRRLEQRIDAHRAGEPLRWSLDRGL